MDLIGYPTNTTLIPKVRPVHWIFPRCNQYFFSWGDKNEILGLLKTTTTFSLTSADRHFIPGIASRLSWKQALELKELPWCWYFWENSAKFKVHHNINYPKCTEQIVQMATVRDKHNQRNILIYQTLRWVLARAQKHYFRNNSFLKIILLWP